ncbi:unnamed protein product [Amoebophrya sp. A120]|nr:unnamed protein product [Amoebophrya sp. A120]|eukprot:GSA120T00012359001.1
MRKMPSFQKAPAILLFFFLLCGQDEFHFATALQLTLGRHRRVQKLGKLATRVQQRKLASSQRTGPMLSQLPASSKKRDCFSRSCDLFFRDMSVAAELPARRARDCNDDTGHIVGMVEAGLRFGLAIPLFVWDCACGAVSHVVGLNTRRRYGLTEWGRNCAC